MLSTATPANRAISTDTIANCMRIRIAGDLTPRRDTRAAFVARLLARANTVGEYKAMRASFGLSCDLGGYFAHWLATGMIEVAY